MKKLTLLFVEEYENILSRSVVSNGTINLVLIRFEQNTFFNQNHLDATSNIPCFVFDKTKSVEHEVEKFRRFCANNEIVVDYFYNDSEYNQEVIQKFASLLKLPGALKRKTLFYWKSQWEKGNKTIEALNEKSKSPRTDANDGEKAGVKLAKMLNYTYSLFGGMKWRQQNQKFPSFQIFRFAAGNPL